MDGTYLYFLTGHLDEQSDDDEDSEEETTETSSEETEDEHQGRRRKKTGNTESNTWPRFSDLGTPSINCRIVSV